MNPGHLALSTMSGMPRDGATIFSDLTGLEVLRVACDNVSGMAAILSPLSFVSVTATANSSTGSMN